MRTTVFACLIAGALLLLPAPQTVEAQSAGVTRAEDRVGQIFSDLEKRKIREVLAGAGIEKSEDADKEETDTKKAGKGSGKGRQGGLPPGLAKRDQLPPGLQKQLDRNGRLPPGLDRQALPADLENRLQDRTNTERVIVDNDVVLVEKGTDLVLDVIHDVVRQKTGSSQ